MLEHFSDPAAVRASSVFPTAAQRAYLKECLDSWKEIAVFLKRGVRTVQRWERYEGLPVHRHQHGKRGSVYAVAWEIESWFIGLGEVKVPQPPAPVFRYPKSSDLTDARVRAIFPTATKRADSKVFLDSWKEIAVFVKRGVRTVQRWEKNEGLPVRRHQHTKRGSVYAVAWEIEAWFNGHGEVKVPPTPASVLRYPKSSPDADALGRACLDARRRAEKARGEFTPVQLPPIIFLPPLHSVLSWIEGHLRRVPSAGHQQIN